MSFGKLLATGKSLVGADTSGRYQANRRALLPKFGWQKNPFTPPPAKEAPAPEPACVVPAPEVAQVPAPAKPVEAKPVEVKPVEAKPALMPPNNAVRTSAWNQAGQWMNAKAKKLNPISWFTHRTPSKQSAIPQLGNNPVQGELRLEKVRVVRNDLSDADLEVVQVGATETKNESGGSAWGHLTTRIFSQRPD